ncbi:hypothetical protein ACIA8K_40225 [Catenuloplanes sp. NPDC051500]|uniref:hypothetical protein n=1 Tax=Catenuloplanes sp. NPDC051500 TaxID=3363959 RepID=UPI0037A6A537
MNGPEQAFLDWLEAALESGDALAADTDVREHAIRRIRADLESSAGALTSATPGRHWAWALTRLDREEDCYSWAERLVASPSTRRDGVWMAVEAMRTWRAAPARLTPMLTGLLRDGRAGIRSAALQALAMSQSACRLAADDLATMLEELGPPAAIALGKAGDHRAVPHLVRLMLSGSDEPRLLQAFRAVARSGADAEEPVSAARRILAAHPSSSPPELPMRVLAAFGPAAAAAVPELLATIEGAENDTPDLAFHVLGQIGPAAAAAIPTLRRYPSQVVMFALLRTTVDRTIAERYLARLPDELRGGRSAAMLLTWLAEHGGLDDRQHRQVRSLFRAPGSRQVYSAAALWLHEGPAAAAELLDALPMYLTDDLYAPEVVRVFAMMGPHARPILGRLDEFATSRHRAPFNASTPEAEIYADETVLAAVLAARDRITALPEFSGHRPTPTTTRSR